MTAPDMQDLFGVSGSALQSTAVSVVQVLCDVGRDDMGAIDIDAIADPVIRSLFSRMHHQQVASVRRSDIFQLQVLQSLQALSGVVNELRQQNPSAPGVVPVFNIDGNVAAPVVFPMHVDAVDHSASSFSSLHSYATSSGSSGSSGPLQCLFCPARHNNEKSHCQHMQRLVQRFATCADVAIVCCLCVHC